MIKTSDLKKVKQRENEKLTILTTNKVKPKEFKMKPLEKPEF